MSRCIQLATPPAGAMPLSGEASSSSSGVALVFPIWQARAMRTVKASRPDDSAEREADHLAGQPPRQRSYACGGTCPKCRANVPGPFVAHVVASPGHTLADSARRFFESRLARDLGSSSLQTGADATDFVRGIGAHAFTFGNDIFIDSARAAPDTPQWSSVLAHEHAYAVHHNDGRVHRVPDESRISDTPSRYSYSTNCSWIDWSHANADMTTGLIQSVQDASDRSAASCRVRVGEENTHASMERLLELGVEVPW